MPDTGAPWNIPYVESTDLVSDWPADSLALANAIDAGLDAVGGLVDVKSALFTGTQSNSTAGQANFAVTDLSITHAVADAANRVILLAHIGTNGHSNTTRAPGFAFADDGTLVAIGDAASNRTRVASGIQGGVNANYLPGNAGMPQSIMAVLTPGDTASHTYTVRAVNVNNSTNTLYINRTGTDVDAEASPRASSSFTLMEVKV